MKKNDLKEKLIEFLSKENIEIKEADIVFEDRKEPNGKNFYSIIDTGYRKMKITIFDKNVDKT